MAGSILVGRGFRLVAQAGDQIWLEFDDMAAVADGLREFLRGWEAAWVRPPGEVFRLWVGQRDFVGLLHGTAQAPADCRFLAGYLLVRATPDRPCGGCSNLAWVIVQPDYDGFGHPRVVGVIEDRPRGVPGE